MKNSKELKIGVVSLCILALAIWGINFMKGESLFESNKRIFFTSYANVEGLSLSSLVTMNGKKIGKVTKVDFHPKLKDKMLVELTLDNEVKFSKSSIAKMYIANMVSGVQNIAIEPKLEGEVAVSGDVLVGVKGLGMIGNVQSQLKPMQSKLDAVLLQADKIFGGVNSVLDEKAQKSLNKSLISFEVTVAQINSTMRKVNKLLKENESDLKNSISNASKITTDLSKVSSELASADLSTTIKKLDKSIGNMNTMLNSINSGKGSVGKLINDDKMYDNFTNATKELEELLREIKLNPKRFVHFSLFGKKSNSK